MRYLITERQLQLLTESDALNWVKRRANKETLKKYISDAEMDFPTLCDDFKDEFEYAHNVIRYAVDYFLTTQEEMFLDEIYDDVNDIVVDMCKEWFGEYLFEIYRNTCPEENQEGLYEQYWENAEKAASGPQKCGLTKGGDDCSSREMRLADKESARLNKLEAKQNAADLKKTFDMGYDRENQPLPRNIKKQVESQFQEFKSQTNDLLGGGQYSSEQKFAVLNKVLDWVHNVPTISYTIRLAKKFNNPNIKNITIQELAKYAQQMGWDNFINWYNSGGPEIK